jgi:hypothetical protein
MMDGLAFLPVLDLHVVGSGITVDCGIIYVPNGWWKQVGYVLRPDGLLDFVLDSAV